MKGNFAIDKTLGRDVSIEISYQIPEPPLSFDITYPNGSNIRPQIPADQTTYVYTATEILDVNIKYHSKYKCLLILLYLAKHIL